MHVAWVVQDRTADQQRLLQHKYYSQSDVLYGLCTVTADWQAAFCVESVKFYDIPWSQTVQPQALN